MSNKVFNLVSSFKSAEENDDGLFIEGMASTNDVDRIGDVIEPSAWSKGGLKNFKKNPIILFNHNHDTPIGKATEVEVTDKGLRIKAFISKGAPKGVFQLIKDGILGAFSVGFLIKDADYVEETGGLLIKAAELFENSVVSVPMNQSATFSLAKSFDSVDEYEEFKKTFTNRVDLAGQSLAGDETTVSNSASDTLEGAKEARKEIKMDKSTSNTPDLEAVAKQVAEDVIAAQAMQKAKEKAQKDADAAAKAAKEAEIKTQVSAGVAGVEKLVEDLEAKFTAKEADFDAIVKELKDEVATKAQELENFKNSKRQFVDRTPNLSRPEALKANQEELVHAHLFGTITGKGWDTELGRNALEKAGMDYTTDTTAGDLDQEVRDLIQKEIWMETKVASLFREVQVNGRATVLPLQTDTGYASWNINTNYNNDPYLPSKQGDLENRENATADTYKARSVTMLVDRMISATYIDNDVEEKTLVNLLPMLFQGVARAHARKVESAIMYPSVNGGAVAHVTDLENAATASGIVSAAPAATAPWTANNLVAARGTMGKYGMSPSDIAYVVAMDVYYDLLQDPEFQNLNEVGDIATKLRGVVGGIFGSPVIVSEEFPAGDVADAIGAYVINRNNYIIPRLRGINVEQDYEVANQRKMIVASQSLGFTELFAAGATGAPVVSVAYGAAV